MLVVPMLGEGGSTLIFAMAAIHINTSTKLLATLYCVGIIVLQFEMTGASQVSPAGHTYTLIKTVYI